MYSRGKYLQQLGSIGIFGALTGFNFKSSSILKRIIPSTGEALPAIGLGTWRVFNVGHSDQELTPLMQVVKNLFENEGRVIDSSPMYGESERVVGDVSSTLKLNKQLFLATKVWTSGLENGKQQIERSFQLYKREKIDLLQIHNLQDWSVHLKTLQQLKADGKIRYIGVTHYTDGMHSTLASVLKNNPIDFVQVNYNIFDRNAEKELLPAAQDKGVAVITNRPFEEGALFQRVARKPLPEWANEFDCKTWSQFFLKYILSNPAVTCSIPGTSKPSHMLENINAAYGQLPNQVQRKRMVQYFESI